MNYFEYIWVWIISILAIVVITWLIFSPVNLLRELNALPTVAYQVDGDVFTHAGDKVSPGDTIHVGTSLTGRNNSHLILKLSDRSFIHFSGDFEASYLRIEQYRLPVFQLTSGWMNIKRHVSDMQVAAAFQTPAGILETSADASSWLTHPFIEIYASSTTDEVQLLVPNGPVRWTEEAGSTTLRSGSMLRINTQTTNRQLTVMPPPAQIVSPEDDAPQYFPGELARGYTITWQPSDAAPTYAVRVERDGNLLPYYQTTSHEAAYTISGLDAGSYIIRIGSLHHAFGVSRWSDGFGFTVGGRVNESIDCSRSEYYVSYTQVRGKAFIYGCVPESAGSVHAGVYTRADAWYLQSAPGLYGVLPSADGYWEIAVADAPLHRVVIKPTTKAFDAVTSTIHSTGTLFATDIEITP